MEKTVRRSGKWSDGHTARKSDRQSDRQSNRQSDKQSVGSKSWQQDHDGTIFATDARVYFDATRSTAHLPREC